jgi:serine protease Do
MIREAKASWSVAFSPDGDRALLGLWDLSTGQIVKILTAPTIGRPMKDVERAVMSVAFSPDGKRALSGNFDGTVRLWGDPSAYVGRPEPAPRVAAETPSSARSKAPPKVATVAPPLVPESSPKLAEPSPAPGLAIQTAVWTPLPKKFRQPPLRNKQSAEILFAKARASVWVVIATTSTAQSDASTLVSQGSAVAITRSHLLTNYHVVDGQRFVFVKQGDKIFEATVVSGDKASDRCVLAVKGEVLMPVDGLRDFEELHVGEPVYTIGSPSGLESTLGQGIVSGLRTVAGHYLVQTTAQISPGSSGGGLFDDAGNLVGITSFMLKNSQGLNFAIAAEDYFR